MELFIVINLVVALALVLFYFWIEWPSKPDCSHNETRSVPVVIYGRKGNVLFDFSFTECTECRKILGRNDSNEN